MPTREEVQAALDGNFKRMMDCMGKLTEEELTSRQVTDNWTAKDIIAHVWVRLDEVVRTGKAWRKPRPWQEGVTYDDAWNESQVTSKRILPLITVVDGITGAHRRLMHQLELTDDETLEAVERSPWGPEMTLLDLIYEMAEHYDRHAHDLAVFQNCCLSADDEEPGATS